MDIAENNKSASQVEDCQSVQSLAFSEMSDSNSLDEVESLQVDIALLSIDVPFSLKQNYYKSKFICLTCSLPLSEVNMEYHFRIPPHDTIIYDPLKEIVCCEKCGSSHFDRLNLVLNIHDDTLERKLLCGTCCFSTETNSPPLELRSALSFENLMEYFELRSKARLELKEEKTSNIEFLHSNSLTVCSKCNLEISGTGGFDQNTENITELICQNCTSTNNSNSSLVADRRSFFENEISRNFPVLGSVDCKKVLMPPISDPVEENGVFDENYFKEPGKKSQSNFTFDSSPLPRLRYNTMDEYFNSMCYKLFLEQELSIPEDRRLVLKYSDFDLEWSEEYHRRSDYFTISIPWSKNFARRFLSKKMEKMGKSPFFNDQGMILMLGDDVPLYCYVTSAKFEREQNIYTHKWQTKEPKVLIVSIKRYSWNKNTLPTTKKLNRLEILPVSVPTSRLFAAMSKLQNPKFIELILGNTEIWRDNFANSGYLLENEALNVSQTCAIETVLRDMITVIQGPPGTGKTWTIYKLISKLLLTRDLPILVVAASNLAVDNIVERLIPEYGDSIIRVVAVSKEAEYPSDGVVGTVCLHNKVYKEMPMDIKRLIDKLRDPKCFISEKDFKKVMNAQIDCSNKIMKRSKVILATSVSAGGIQLQNLDQIPVVIMDEATQSSEVTSLIPLALPGVRKFVFVGDQNQLSSFSPIPELSFSLFERMLANGTYAEPIMLDTQYRMHPAISEFPKNEFYGGLLKDGITLKDRQYYGIPSDPLVFWDTCNKCPEEVVVSKFFGDDGRTYCNLGEVAFIERVLEHLIQVMHVKRSEIGVITPYRGQRDLVSNLLALNRLINPSGESRTVETNRDEFDESKTVTIHSVSDIMIASIDAFQGREKDFMVMSCVRSNEKNSIGFLKERRRLNVALTRAKYGLVVIGDAYCLKNGDDLWKGYIEYLEKRGSVLKKGLFGFH